MELKMKPTQREGTLTDGERNHMLKNSYLPELAVPKAAPALDIHVSQVRQCIIFACASLSLVSETCNLKDAFLPNDSFVVSVRGPVSK